MTIWSVNRFDDIAHLANMYAQTYYLIKHTDVYCYCIKCQHIIKVFLCVAFKLNKAVISKFTYALVSCI